MSNKDTSDVIVLRKQMSAIQDRINEIEGARLAEENAAVVGKCFKYRNCYSCPKDDSERWWLYQRVTSVTKHGRLNVFSFQVDKDGQFSCEETTRSVGILGEPITLKQFQHAWRITARMLNDRARKAGAYQP